MTTYKVTHVYIEKQIPKGWKTAGFIAQDEEAYCYHGFIVLAQGVTDEEKKEIRSSKEHSDFIRNTKGITRLFSDKTLGDIFIKPVNLISIISQEQEVWLTPSGNYFIANREDPANDQNRILIASKLK